MEDAERYRQASERHSDRQYWSRLAFSAGAALQRARRVLLELETSRKSEDIERVRHGAMYEVEYALRILGFPFERTPETDERVARYHPGVNRVGPLTVDQVENLYGSFTERQRRDLFENTPVPIEPELPFDQHEARLTDEIKTLADLVQVPPDVLMRDRKNPGADGGDCTSEEP